MVLLSLDNLSTELLVKIFKYLEISDLCKVKRTCKRFNEIVHRWEHLFIENKRLLVTNEVHSKIDHRSAYVLSLFERYRIAKNWKRGVYKERQFLETRIKYIPSLVLEQHALWLSRGNSIKAYKRTPQGLETREPIYSIYLPKKAEISRFVQENDRIFTGQADGTLWLYSKNDHSFLCKIPNAHNSDINSVDMCGNICVSGSRDESVKIWNVEGSNFYKKKCDGSIQVLDRVWSVSLSHNAREVAVGTSGVANKSIIRILDLSKNEQIVKLDASDFGAGVLDLKWDSPSLLWSCGYDAHLRRWDVRTGSCVQSFEEPMTLPLYCLEYDRCNAVIGGTQLEGRSVLWDIRKKNYMQTYFMECCKGRTHNSPVYSLAFDTQLLFTATDRHVSILDFSVSKGIFRDYSKLLINLIKG